jgi:hypothetical protein
MSFCPFGFSVFWVFDLFGFSVIWVFDLFWPSIFFLVIYLFSPSHLKTKKYSIKMRFFKAHCCLCWMRQRTPKLTLCRWLWIWPIISCIWRNNEVSERIELTSWINSLKSALNNFLRFIGRIWLMSLWGNYFSFSFNAIFFLHFCCCHMSFFKFMLNG